MDPNVVLYDELPSWANKENREIHKKLLQKNQELQALKAESTELQDRLNVLQEHLKSVSTEVNLTQELLTAKEKQADEEAHLQQLSEREYGKIVSELSKIEEKTTDIQAKWSEVQAKTFKSQQRIDAFKEEAQATEEQLQQWVQAARDKEEDFLVIQRYQREDEGRIRSMLLEIEKSQGVVEAKRAELDQEVTNTRALQIELDMTAEQFRKLHDERTQLLNQWENTLRQMQQLNQAIEKSTENFDSRKGETERVAELLKEQKKNLEQAEAENAALERRLTIGDHQVSQKHKKMEKEEMDLLEFNETVETQRHQLEKLEGDARFYRAEIEDYKNKTVQEHMKTEAFMKRLEQTKNALYTQKDNTEEINQQTSVMNEFLKKEEATLKSIEKAIEAEKNQIFKLGQQVYEERKREKNLLADMQGSQSRAKNLQLKIHEFDRETQKQEELKYNSNFQIQQMERKIARIEGDRTEEEKIELQTQIEQLEGVLKEKMETEKMLAQQLHRLELDLRQTARRKESGQAVQNDLETKLTELRLDQDSLDKSTIKARTQKESVLVQINMLRLQVEKLSDQVATKSDELISLENRRKQLQLSMEERILEIDKHLIGLRTQVKTEEEARHMANIELQERKKRAETLESKYQVMMGKYKVDGEEVSQAYHVIKFARERDEVTRRGDELEAEVKKAVKELRALERAMNKLDGQNNTFRQGFAAIGQDDTDMERKNTLEEQRKVIQQRLNSRRAECRDAEEQRLAMETAYDQQQARIQQLQNEIKRIEPLVERTTKENQELKDKLKRATIGLSKAKEAHRKSENVSIDAPYPATLTEMDIELKSVKNVIDSSINELANLAEQNRELEPKLRLALTQIGLKMRQLGAGRPQTTVRPVRSGTSSATSSRSNLSALSNRSGSSQGSVRSKASAGSTNSRGSTASKASRGSNASSRSARSNASNLSSASDLSVTSINSASSKRSQTSSGARVIKPKTQTTPRKTSALGSKK